jgi:glycosyltransferase involved in cell wall biosynthesis
MSSGKAGQPRISVIVCTRNRRSYLGMCLGALERQTLAARDYEVIVVDNGSTDDTRSVAAAFCERNRNFCYVHEAKAGLAIARNVGVHASSADIVAFTDDDAQPHATWLERIVRRFDEHPEDVAMVGGDVVPVWEAERPAWLIDSLLPTISAGLRWSTEPRFLRPGEWLFEGNSGYKKAALLRVGGYPEHLGRVGDMLLSGEGACHLLIQRAGHRLFYDPAILIRHHIQASRLTRTWFRKRYFWQGITMNLLHRYVEEEARRLGLPESSPHARAWEDVPVPASADAWADLFDDSRDVDFYVQLQQLHQLGYLFESQSIVIGH